MELYELPADIKIPMLFARSRIGRVWFTVGVRDVIQGSPLRDETQVRRRRGNSAWLAYQAGRHAASKSKQGSLGDGDSYVWDKTE